MQTGQGYAEHHLDLPQGLIARFRSAIAGNALVRDAGLLLLILFLAFLTLYPLAMLFYGSLSSTPPGMEGVLNLDGYAKVLNQRNASILFDTVALSLVKTVIALGTAVLLAWIIARTDTPMRRSLEVVPVAAGDAPQLTVPHRAIWAVLEPA